jgi:hypothetical protein
MFGVYRTGKGLLNIVFFVILGSFAVWYDPWGMLPFVATALGLFVLLTWLVAPKKPPRQRIDESS